MEVAHPHSGRFLVEFEFGNVGFEERGKPEYLKKNLSEQGREPTTNSAHTWRRRRDLNPGHIGGSMDNRKTVGCEPSHHCVILAPQRGKKIACRVKVTNLSEQSLNKKYSGTTRVYSLSRWNFFVPTLIKPTDLE